MGRGINDSRGKLFTLALERPITGFTPKGARKLIIELHLRGSCYSLPLGNSEAIFIAKHAGDMFTTKYGGSCKADERGSKLSALPMADAADNFERQRPSISAVRYEMLVWRNGGHPNISDHPGTNPLVRYPLSPSVRTGYFPPGGKLFSKEPACSHI